MNPRGKVKQGCNGNLVIVPGCINYLLRRGEAVYCHINDYSIFQPARSIFESGLALEADCCSHSCDYGHKTTKKIYVMSFVMTLHLYDLTLWLGGNWWFLIYVMITHNKTHLTQTKGSKFKKGRQHCLHSPNAHNDLNDFCTQKGQNNNKINKQSGAESQRVDNLICCSNLLLLTGNQSEKSWCEGGKRQIENGLLESL